MTVDSSSDILALEASIHEICQPLFLKSPLTYFHYLKIYLSGQAFVLSTDERPIIYCAEHQLCPTLECWDSPQPRKLVWNNELFGLCAFEPLRHESLHTVLREQFNLDFIFNFVQKNITDYEFYCFGAPPEHHEAMEYYICNIKTLNEFRFYFKDHARSHIQKYDNPMYYLQLIKAQQHQASRVLRPFFETELQSVNVPTPKRYYLEGKYHGITLSLKEAECLKQLAEGKTAKEAALSLHVSHRTVEKYIDQLRKRFNCISKSELSRIAYELGIKLN
jgi:DNA-binding CsgD family transcriptional regulator